MFDKFAYDMNEGLKFLNIEIDNGKIKKFYDFYEELVRVNQYMNLTAITEMKEAIYKHFIDSLALVFAIKDLDKKGKDFKVIDVGSGAGFPGIPLAIAFPNVEFVLIDSLNKRIKFIEDIKSKLNLENLSAFHSRAEDFALDKNNREGYDLAVSRAVANLSILSEYCIPFVKLSGNFISYKSGNVSEEVENSKQAIKILGAKLGKIKDYELPWEMGSITLVCIEKINKTPTKYPRKAGMAKQKPL